MARRWADEDEHTLVALAKIGNSQAFSELVIRHQSWIRNLQRRLVSEATLADDLSQQTFIEAWTSIKSLQSITAYRAWLRKIAMNTWLKHIRKKDPLHRAATFDDENVAPAGCSVSEGIDIDDALRSLPEVVRACIVLFYHEGMGHGSISELTGLPLGTVKSHISRGRRKLQDFLIFYRPPAKSA